MAKPKYLISEKDFSELRERASREYYENRVLQKTKTKSLTPLAKNVHNIRIQRRAHLKECANEHYIKARKISDLRDRIEWFQSNATLYEAEKLNTSYADIIPQLHHSSVTAFLNKVERITTSSGDEAYILDIDGWHADYSGMYRPYDYSGMYRPSDYSGSRDTFSDYSGSRGSYSGSSGSSFAFSIAGFFVLAIVLSIISAIFGNGPLGFIGQALGFIWKYYLGSLRLCFSYYCWHYFWAFPAYILMTRSSGHRSFSSSTLSALPWCPIRPFAKPLTG